MALDAGILEKEMLQSIRDEMQLIHGDSQPMEYHEALSKALSQSVIKILKSSAMGIGAVATKSLGIKVKTIEVQDAMMTTVAFGEFKQKFPKATDFTEKFFKAVMRAIKKHLEEAEVASISGFGGPVLSIVGLDPKGAALMALVKAQMPSKFIRGRAGLPFIQSLCAGVSAGILAGKVPAPIPETFAFPPSGPIGPTIAKFS